jgi:hypothetical protein
VRVAGLSAIEASPGFLLIEVAGFCGCGLDVESEGLRCGDVRLMSLGADPLLGAAKVKGELELIVVP